METNKDIKTVDDYIKQFPEDVQIKLKEIRKTIKNAAPEAEEKISYKMPGYYFKGNLVYFAAYAKHIGFYPTPSGISAFQKEIAQYKYAKGSVQFPLNKPLPLNLIEKITLFRINENLNQGKK